MTKHLIAIAIIVALPFSAHAESAAQASFGSTEATKIAKVVAFDWGKVRVDWRGRSDLKAVAKAWRQSAAKTVITVEGFAVAEDEEASISLGQKRADRVRNYLVRFGVDPQFVVAVGNARLGIEEGGGRYVDLTLEAQRTK